jgi:hypothetical protein
MTRVFISHSTQDREFVDQEVVTFLKAHGVPFWYAPSDIQSTEHFERSILQALRQCDYFLVVMSPRSAQSLWVKREVDWVFHRGGKTIVPVLLEACDSDDFHIGLVNIQRVDFSRDRAAGRKALLAACRKPNDPPGEPKAGEIFTLRITAPKAGEVITVKIPVVDRGPQPGTLTILTWKPVPARPNSHK